MPASEVVVAVADDVSTNSGSNLIDGTSTRCVLHVDLEGSVKLTHSLVHRSSTLSATSLLQPILYSLFFVHWDNCTVFVGGGVKGLWVIG